MARLRTLFEREGQKGKALAGTTSSKLQRRNLHIRTYKDDDPLATKLPTPVLDRATLRATLSLAQEMI